MSKVRILRDFTLTFGLIEPFVTLILQKISCVL